MQDPAHELTLEMLTIPSEGEIEFFKIWKSFIKAPYPGFKIDTKCINTIN